MAYSQITVTDIDNEIEFGETAIFRISITNEAEEIQTYSFIALPSIEWSVTPSVSSITIDSGKTGSAEVGVTPMARHQPGIYLVAFKIKSSRGESYEPKLKIYMGPAAPREYTPSIVTSVDVNENIDPRQTQSVKVFLQNQNPLEYRDLIVSLQSDLEEFAKEQAVDLKAYESKTVEFTVTPNPHEQPKDYSLNVVIQRSDIPEETEGRILKFFTKKITIIPLTPDFIQATETKKSFLKTVSVITFTNDGNVENTQTAKVTMSALKDFFTSSNQETSVLKDEQGNRYLAWNLELGVSESASLILTTNYRIPAVLLVILIIVLIFYLVYRNPIQVTKAASNVIVHEGSVSGLKITLVIKNLSNHMLKDVEVFDTAPSIASVEKDVDIGTLQPAEILRDRKGSILLKWKVSELEAKEERLISYKIKSKLDIVGTIHLQRAKVKFKSARGQNRISYSNTYRVGGEMENKE